VACVFFLGGGDLGRVWVYFLLSLHASGLAGGMLCGGWSSRTGQGLFLFPLWGRTS